MRKGREFIGLPIVEAISGQRLGEVVDLVLNSAMDAISGFLIDKGNWFRSPKQVPVEMVQQVNGDEIRVGRAEAVELNQCGPLASSLTDKKVATTGGKLLGTVQDVVMDDASFKLIGYEVSDGLITDLVAGRVIIDQPSIITQSNHAVVVGDELTTIWDNQS